MSVACAAASLIFTGISLEIAYGRSGQAGSIVGLLGVLAMVSCVAGFILALRGMKEEDVYLISAQAGVAVNGILFILWAEVCVIGM